MHSKNAAIPAPPCRPRAAGFKALMIGAMLFLIPLAAYWPTTFHDYGLRDDYSNMREAREEPGKVLEFCASQARPLYGLLLRSSFARVASVRDLEWLRLLGALLLGAVASASFLGLRRLGWSDGASLVFAALVGLTPAAQVIAGWAIGWPYALTALIAFGGFFAAELGLAARTGGARAALLSAAFASIAASALIYQPSTFFYLVPMSAAFIAARARGTQATLRWLARHIALIAAALGAAYATMSALYAAGIFEKSERVAIETQWGGKLLWYAREVLPNALSVFVLNDDHGRGRAQYLIGAALLALLLSGGAALEWRRHGRARGLLWLTALAGLPLFAVSVSMIAAERYATYRTIFAMTAVLVCFAVASADALTANWSKARRTALAASAFLGALLTAQYHAYALLALPQGHEWRLVMNGAERVQLRGLPPPRIFIVAPDPADSSTARIYHDEFGSLSSNSDWVPKEMFKRAMRDLHPTTPHLDSRYAFASGDAWPKGRFDVVVDMRRLRLFRAGDQSAGYLAIARSPDSPSGARAESPPSPRAATARAGRSSSAT